MSDFVGELNRLAGTIGLEAAGAANALAGSVGKEMIGALNIAAGTTGLEFDAVCRAIGLGAGGSGPDALALLPAGLVLDGATNSCATVPDAATWNVSGLLGLAVRVKATDWTPAAAPYLIAHHEPTGNQRSWGLDITTTGTLNFVASSAGTTANVNQNSSALTVIDGMTYWVGCEYNTATGALTFYQAPDNVTMPAMWAGWTQISTHTVTALAFFDSTAALSIGGTGGVFASRLTGTIYEARVYDDGVLIASPNFGVKGNPRATRDAATYTDSVGNVWTLRGTARIA